MSTDLLIVGGGPAGLATALYAARAGLSTTVIERREGAIDKACGEGLMPGAVRALTDLGVRLQGRPIRGIRYTDGRRTAEAPFRHGTGLGVRRTTLHAALLDAVRCAGVPVVHERAADVRVDVHGVQVDGRRARYLAVADGLHSPTRTHLGLSPEPRGKGNARWGIRQHFALAPWTDFVEVHWAAQCEAYVTPVDDHAVGVAILSSAQAPFAEQLQAFSELRERIAGAPVATSVRGAGPLRQRVPSRTAGRGLLVGDAAGYVDALTGEGIAVALDCARALVDCIAMEQPEDYERQWLAVSRRYRTITSTLLWARNHPPLARRIVPMAARLPRLFGAAVGQLAG